MKEKATFKNLMAKICMKEYIDNKVNLYYNIARFKDKFRSSFFIRNKDHLDREEGEEK